MPFPGGAVLAWAEVRCPVVVDTARESQQAAVHMLPGWKYKPALHLTQKQIMGWIIICLQIMSSLINASKTNMETNEGYYYQKLMTYSSLCYMTYSSLCYMTRY